MTFSELQILLDISKGNECALLEEHASWTDHGYFFVDFEDGQCYLFDENGKMDNVNKIPILLEEYVKKDIKKIVIPESVKRIGDWTFADCTSLTSIEIPKSVESIGYRAFYNCKSLEEVIFKGKTFDQVKEMDNYPWEIEDKAIIKCS